MHNDSVPDWNDIRFVLEVVRSGSTLAASRHLKVSQSTVMRRIAALEQAIGLELFVKNRLGYEPSEGLHGLLPTLIEIERAHSAFASGISEMRRAISGAVRLTAPEILCATVLNKAAAQMRQLYPGIGIEIVASERRLDLARGEADIAIRGGGRPTDNELFGRCLAHETWSFYCSKAYAETQSVPRDIPELLAHPILGLQAGSFSGPIMDWIQQHLHEDAVIVRHSGLVPLYYGIKSGLGISILSDVVTMGDDDFVRCFTPPDFMQTEVWLLAHERNRQTARVRAVMDFIGNYFSQMWRDSPKSQPVS